MERQPTRIICVGDRFCPTDLAGPLVYDRLVGSELPDGIEAIDGGRSGHDLLTFIEGARRIVFVDSVTGIRGREQVIVLDASNINRHISQSDGAQTGLPELLNRLPGIIEGDLPEIHIIGIEGFPGRDAVASAAFLSLEMALQGPARHLPDSVH